MHKLFVTCLKADLVILKSTLWKKAENHSVGRPRRASQDPRLPPFLLTTGAGLRDASASFLLYLWPGIRTNKPESGINLLLL